MTKDKTRETREDRTRETTKNKIQEVTKDRAPEIKKDKALEIIKLVDLALPETSTTDKITKYRAPENLRKVDLAPLET